MNNPRILSFLLVFLFPALAQAQTGMKQEEQEVIEIIDIIEEEGVETIMQVPPAPQLGEDATYASSSETDSNEVFTIVEQMPLFPGGQDSLLRYMATVKYPEEARKKDIEGRTFIQFVVEKDGSVSNVKVLRSANELLDAAAMAHVQRMPRWEKPGMENGKPVRVTYTIPVSFKLK